MLNQIFSFFNTTGTETTAPSLHYSSSEPEHTSSPEDTAKFIFAAIGFFGICMLPEICMLIGGAIKCCCGTKISVTWNGSSAIDLEKGDSSTADEKRSLIEHSGVENKSSDMPIATAPIPGK